MMPPFTAACQRKPSTASARHRFAGLLLLCAALGTAGCHDIREVSGNPAPGPDVPRPEAVLDFKSLYGQNCSACHGEHGNYGAASNLANPEYEAWIDDKSLHNIIANGEKGVLMPAFAKTAGGSLTEQQVDVLVHGMRQAWAPHTTPFGGMAPPPYHPDVAANARAGQAVYQAACARCHGIDHTHPGPSGSILDGTFLALVNDQTIRTTVIAGRPDVGQPDWRGDVPGQPLTDAQVTDVAAWMLSQRPAHSGHPYPLTPNTQPTSERPGEQQPLSEERSGSTQGSSHQPAANSKH